MGPSDIDAFLNDAKDYIQSTYHGLKEFNFDDDLFGTDNTSVAEPFQLIESESALDGFVKQYTIKPKKNYDHHSFFNEVKEKIIKLFRSHPYRNIRMILNGNMERYTLRG